MSTGFAALLITGFAFAEPLPRQRPDEAVSLYPRRARILHDPIVDLSQRNGQVIAPDPDQVGLSIVLWVVDRFRDGDRVSERVCDPVYGIVIQRPLKFAGTQSVYRQIPVVILAVCIAHVAVGPPLLRPRETRRRWIEGNVAQTIR